MAPVFPEDSLPGLSEEEHNDQDRNECEDIGHDADHDLLGADGDGAKAYAVRGFFRHCLIPTNVKIYLYEIILNPVTENKEFCHSVNHRHIASLTTLRLQAWTGRA